MCIRDRVDHDINIDDKGRATLTIEYRAFSEETIQGPEFNVLYPSKSTWKAFTALQEGFENVTSQCDSLTNEELADDAGGESISDLIDDALKKYEEEIDDLKYEGYQKIIKTMVDHQRIFNFFVTKTQIITARVTGDWYSAIIGSLAEQVLAEQIELANVSGTIPESSDALRELSDNAQERFSDDTGLAINYFFLGDLIDAVYNYAYVRDDKPIKLKIIFPTIPYRTRDQTLKYMNLAHLPISVDYYNEWFAANVISTDVSTFSLIDFVRIVTQNFLEGALGAECDGGRKDFIPRLQIGFLKGADN